MPSYKLGTAVKTDMNIHCRNILQRQRDYALQGIPVTHAQLQGSAVADRAMLETLQRLDAQGVQGIIQQVEFPVVILTKNFPGLHRDVLLHLSGVPKPVFMAQYPRATARHGRGMSNVIQDNRNDRPVVLDPALFDIEQCEALVTWANNVVRTRRVMSMVIATVEDVLTNVTTTGHIIARWPVLARLVEDKKWQTKLRMKPERLGACGWPPGTLTNDLLARMKASEPVLIMAEMLEPPSRPNEGAIQAHLWAYQAFESDRFNA